MAYTNIDDPSAHFQTKIYSGQNSVQSVTNDGNSNLKPDWLWIKSRNDSDIHVITNSTTGTDLYLQTNNDAGEVSSTGDVESFDTNGFSLAGVNDRVNTNGGLFVAWQWKANGGTTTSKSSATVSGNVTTPCVQQVNTDAGFSIITYTASTSYAGTETHLEHGLGVGPKVLIVKRRDTAADWAVYHAGNGASSNAGYGYNVLNSTAATATSSTYWLNTPAESNSTLLAFGNNASVGADSGEYVCYAFAEKQGYSKFGGYVGNGNDNGPFIYTGFKPAFVLTKGTNVSQWRLYDSARSPNNVNINRLFPYSTSAEATDTDAGIDMLSNGFKIRGSGGDYNASGTTYIYMAFADNPFVTSTGIPTTAR